MKIENLTVRYGENTVYENFNLEIEDGAVTCVLGESGCGKTTLLNAVAGIVAYGGAITPVKPSYVFQTHRLLPALTVLKNLTVIGADEGEAIRLLKEIGLGDKMSAYPKTLSGGEAQRVSLLRAFLYPSDILLMDEPFSSLDIKTKRSVMQLFKNIHERDGRTALFVTHDVDEAIFLSDRIVVIDGGNPIADFKQFKKGDFGANLPVREEIIKVLLDN